MADEKDPKKQNQLNIELTEEIAEGTYSNLAIITHSNSEFVVDFVRVMPGVPKAKVKSRVMLTPFHAKRLQKALTENIKKFEANFGPIDEGGGSNYQGGEGGFPPINFGGPTTEA